MTFIFVLIVTFVFEKEGRTNVPKIRDIFATRVFSRIKYRKMSYYKSAILGCKQSMLGSLAVMQSCWEKRVYKKLKFEFECQDGEH